MALPVIANILFPLAPAPGTAGAIANILLSPYALGPEIAVLAAIVVMSVLGVMYMIGPFLGRSDLRTWIRAKIYEEVSSLIFVFAFLVFAVMYATFPITSAFSSIGLVPGPCVCPSTSNNCPQQSPLSPPDPSLYNNFYFLSVCDISTYNSQVSTFNTYTYYLSAVISLSPALSVSAPAQSDAALKDAKAAVEQGGGVATGSIFQNLGGGFEASGSFDSAPTDTDTEGEIPSIGGITVTNIGWGANMALNFLPIAPTFHYVIPLLNMLYVFYILSQVQVLLISAAPLIFALLMALGLVARSFGITRTFGGAMIAFAMGIGFVYPLMTSISYGFLDSSIATAQNQFTCVIGMNPTFSSSCPTIISRVLNLLGDLFSSAWNGNLSPQSLLGDQYFRPIIQSFLIYSGLIAMGLSLIPLLNLTVVDAFIVDFSRAMGERMDFLSLLTRIL